MIVNSSYFLIVVVYVAGSGGIWGGSFLLTFPMLSLCFYVNFSIPTFVIIIGVGADFWICLFV